YWKDNLATWLMGSAAATWLLSDTLLNRGWAFASGCFLGLLVVQRTAVAVYASLLFLPLCVWAAYRRARMDSARTAFAASVTFAAPAVALGSLVLILQWKQLYTHYFVTGYAYGNPMLVARYLLGGFGHIGFVVAAMALCLAYAACLIAISSWRAQIVDVLI